uniref:RRM domain-containing protein n=1 Tax=Aotus nancymaae TaxID=37293 RepID=A0A2K5ELV9_AOTNA
RKVQSRKPRSYNPRAAELFHLPSQALEVLTDAAARAAYDKIRKAKKQAAEMTQKLDEERNKVKLDLEARERQAQAQESEEEEESRSTRTLELIREQIQEHDQRLRGKTENTEGQGTPKLKLKWKCTKEDESNGGSKDVLLRLLQKYGEDLNLVLFSKKAGTAVVEFATVKPAELAVQNEVGLVDNPLKISWLEGQPQGTVGHPGLSKGSVLSQRDYESLIAMLMRQEAKLQQPMDRRYAAGRPEGPPT